MHCRLPIFPVVSHPLETGLVVPGFHKRFAGGLGATVEIGPGILSSRMSLSMDDYGGLLARAFWKTTPTGGSGERLGLPVALGQGFGGGAGGGNCSGVVRRVYRDADHGVKSWGREMAT